MPRFAFHRRNARRILSPLVLTVLLGILALPSDFLDFLQPTAHAAQTFTVNSTGDGADSNLGDGVCNDGAGNCTLRAAIQQANIVPGTDTINFSVTGTINLTGPLPDLVTNITINGPGSGLLTVRRDTGGNYRVFFANGALVNISGLTVTNGRTPDGAPGSTFGGSAQGGGGILNGGTMTLTDVVVTGNSTGNGGVGGSSTGGFGGFGGGISSGGNLTMTDCVVSNNTTGNGATGNFGGSGGRGGGIFTFPGVTTTIVNSTIADNSTGNGGGGFAGQGGFGGGIENNGIMTVTGSTVSGNSTGNAGASGGTGGSHGGGIANHALLTIINSTVSGNSTGGIGGNGGGVYHGGSTLTMTNCTVTGNTSFTNAAHGVFNSSFGGGTFNVRNTVIARNGPGGGGPDVFGAYSSQGHNLIGNAEGSTGFTAAGDQTGTSAAPRDPLLGPLADNGGPTHTHALLAGSLALDAGNNALARDANNNTLTTDQRGAGRFAGPTATVDVGAFEFHPSLEDVSDKTTNEDTQLAFAFNVGDAASPAASATASSSNQTLVPDSNLSVAGVGGVRTLRITPAANQTGTAVITLNVNDPGGPSASDTFVLTVAPVNDAPTFTKGADQVLAEDAGPQSVTNWATGVSAGPSESGQSLSFLVTVNSNPGLFSTGPAVSPSGTLTFTPAANANGSATVTLVLKDDGGTANGGQDTSAPQTLTITLTPVNDAPTTSDQSLNATEDTPRVFSLTGSDVDGDSLSFSVVNGPAHGSLTGAGPTRIYTPAANFNGSDSFTFKAVDTGGAESAIATVSFNVAAVNDAPVNTVPATQTTDRNTPLVFSAANSNALSVVDVDAGNNPVRVTLSATRGTLTLGTTAGLAFITGDGADDATMTFDADIGGVNAALNGLTFKPESGFSGTASLQFTVNDQGHSGSGGSLSSFRTVTIVVSSGEVQLSAPTFAVAEDDGKLVINVARTGDVSSAASVNYATENVSATDKRDYLPALGTLRFAAGETSKSVTVLLIDDTYSEPPESFRLRLSNPVGATLGAISLTTVTLTSNDAADSPSRARVSALDPAFFVRQQYLDFFNREPDAAGLGFWVGQLTQCGSDRDCLARKRVDVSGAFFVSIEFQRTGYFVYRVYQVAFNTGERLALRAFLPDTQEVGRGVIGGAPDEAQRIEANRAAFVEAFVARAEFVAAYPLSLTPEEFVDKLNANTFDPQQPGAGGALTQAEREMLVNELRSGAKTRGQVLRAVAENVIFNQRQFNKAFVLMQYFGYLRRTPPEEPEPGLDFTGYNFWLRKMNEFKGDFRGAQMVQAYLDSEEYKLRFGP